MSTWQHRTECPHVLRLIFFHTLLIHAFINRHLGCFDIVASVSTASVNMAIHIFKTLLLNFFGYMPKSGIAGLCGNCIFFISWGISILFSTVAVWFYTPRKSVRKVQYLHVPANAFCFLFFDSNILMGMRWLKHCFLPCCSIAQKPSMALYHLVNHLWLWIRFFTFVSSIAFIYFQQQGFWSDIPLLLYSYI